MKKKIFSITLAVCLLVLSIASTTLAYFTDVKEKTNVYTSGNVTIELSESALSYTNSDSDSGYIYPGKKISGKATVTNVGTEKAYVGLVVTLTESEASKGLTEDEGRTNNLSQLTSGFTAENTDIFKEILGELDSTKFDVAYKINGDPSSIYIIYKNILNAGSGDDSVIEFFDDITIPAAWGNDEMAYFSGTKVSVTAYATQVAGFSDALTALNTAFNNVGGWGAIATN